MARKTRRWQDVNKNSIALEKLIDTWELDCHTHYSPHTYGWFRQRLTVFRRWLEAEEGATLKDFTQDRAKEFIAYLQRRNFRYENHPKHRPQAGPLSSHTIAGYARALKCFSRWLHNESYTDENILEGFRVPKAVKQAIEILSEDEIDKLFSAVDPGTALGSRDYAILWTFLDCGLRCSELTGLKLEDAHLEEGFLKVLGKGRKERLVPLGVAAQKALLRYRDHFRPFFAELPVATFFVSVDGVPMTSSAVEFMIKRLGRRAGVPRVYAHLLRHTFATRYLVHQCGDVLRLQQILRHSSLEMVRYYAEAAAIHRDILERRSSPMDIYAASRNARQSSRSQRRKKTREVTGKLLHIEKMRKLKAG